VLLVWIVAGDEGTLGQKGMRQRRIRPLIDRKKPLRERGTAGT
jgi:hypothetical protein